MNLAILVGRVGKGGATVRTKDEKKFITFSLATTERFKDKEGNPQEKTEWHNVVSFKPGLVTLASNDNLRQGSLVSIEGMIHTRKYADKDNAEVTRYSTSIVVDSLTVLRFPPKAEPKKEDTPAEKEKVAI